MTQGERDEMMSDIMGNFPGATGAVLDMIMERNVSGLRAALANAEAKASRMPQDVRDVWGKGFSAMRQFIEAVQAGRIA